MKIISRHITVRDEDVPNATILGAYVESLKLYKKDNPDLNKDWALHIDKLPSARFLRQEYSNEECKILFETINYLWKNITGHDIIDDNKMFQAPSRFLVIYWIL